MTHDARWLGEPDHVVRLRRGQLAFFCPGCDHAHVVTVSGPDGAPRWGWNGDFARPTLTPSVLVWAPRVDAPDDRTHLRCHAFVRDGQIQFLSDCHHALAGQTLPLAPFTP